MEQKQSSDDDGSVCYEFPPLSSKYPWFVSQNLGVDKDSSRDQYFYTPHDEPRLKYQCQIPQLHGRRIRGSYHGWVILSEHLENVKWSLWNPATSKVIQFPLLVLKHVDSESIRECCLSAPPEDPSSVLLLTSTNKSMFVFVHVYANRPIWVEMPYTSQLKRISGEDGVILHRLTCCNGKVYALTSNSSFASFVIQIDIAAEVKLKQLIVDFSLFGSFPSSSSWERYDDMEFFLKGNVNELIIIILGFHHESVRAAQLLKIDMASIALEDKERFKNLNMSCKRWDEEEEDRDELKISMRLWKVLEDLKNATVYVDLGRDNVACYKGELASKLGGYMHIRDKTGDIIYSFNVKEKTISISSLPSLVLPTNLVSLWECRVQDHEDHQENVALTSVRHKQTRLDESLLLNLPSHMLEKIMEHCLAVEYMNFRATCKSCNLAAPLIQWNNTTSLTRLQTYSSVSPWLMVLEENVTFTDPILGDKYFMRNSMISSLHNDDIIYCSRFGWLFYFRNDTLHFVLYNPFTKNHHVLPYTAHHFKAGCFSAPPTSPDCMVAGFPIGNECHILIHYVGRESSWQTIHVDAEIPIGFLTFFGKDLYGLDGDGKLVIVKELGKEDYSGSLLAETRVPVTCCTPPTRHYLMECDQYLLKVIVGRFGEGVELFKWDASTTEDWVKIDRIENRMIYICDSICLCIEAKKPEMGNKIYFPILHSKNRRIIYYSLETCRFHTFNGENIQPELKNFIGTTHHLSPHMWIEPSWSTDPIID